jgi:hypothetical protein
MNRILVSRLVSCPDSNAPTQPACPTRADSIGSCPFQRARLTIFSSNGRSEFNRTASVGAVSRIALKITPPNSHRGTGASPSPSYAPAPNENKSMRASSFLARTCFGEHVRYRPHRGSQTGQMLFQDHRRLPANGPPDSVKCPIMPCTHLWRWPRELNSALTKFFPLGAG